MQLVPAMDHDYLPSTVWLNENVPIMLPEVKWQKVKW
jgi:hypothetical protein